MGREVRRVPKDWEHPKYTEETETRRGQAGSYRALFEYADRTVDQKQWDIEVKQYEKGFLKSYKDGVEWEPRGPELRYTTFEKYHGPRPSSANHMPKWADEERTHYQMYEDTSEGTPISPVMETPEELAQWLVDNNASSFGAMTATYEQWLSICKGGWAPSAVIVGGVMQSGVAFTGDQEKAKKKKGKP